MTLITANDELTAFCERVAGAEFITVDTEFIRDKTYWPRLCLVQIGGPDEAAAIDAQAEGIDLGPVFALMAKPDLLKVFHAARQDFEIFYQLSGRIPAPVFDTQVSAMVCGFGDAVSYETLVAKLARKRIDKTMRFTDWERRPLSPKQLDYALADVTHLRVIYEKLHARIERTGRAGWVAEEMAALTDPALYRVDAREAWRRLKVRTAKPRFLAILRELACWREEEAQRRNVPRNRVLRDDALLDVAAHAPDSLRELAGLRSLRGGQAGGTTGEAIMAAIARGKAVPEAECPPAPRSRDGAARTGPAADLLKVLLKMKSDAHDVAQRLIANAEDIEAIATDDNADVPAMHGWRRELFGDDALRLKHGQLALTADGNLVKVVPLDGAASP
jgi:ribonuclease D